MSKYQPLTIAPPPAPELLAAERLYLQDLPQLLATKPGHWVVYTPEGCVAEGTDELALFRWCRERGLQRGQFLVARVEPDDPVADISASWYPLESPERKSDAILSEGP